MAKDVFIIEALHGIARFLAAISMILIGSALTEINWFRPITVRRAHGEAA